MNMASFLLLLTMASCLVWMVACWCVWQFARTRAVASTFTPPVSVLKPVAGVDHEAYTNFGSFCHQDYPDYEVLFGMQDAADPVRPLAERLRREQPELRIETVAAAPLGANAKVANLSALAGSARHDVLAMNDSDMRVTPDYLRRVVAPLRDESVGVVTCLYQGDGATNLAARLGALYVAGAYMPLVTLAARFIRMPYAFGSTIVVRRADLERSGGFAAIADCLADDYELAARIVALGKRVALAPYVVKNILGAESWREMWEREVRWMRCTRVSRPLEYPGLLLTQTVPLALATACVMGFDRFGCNVLVGALCVRWASVWLMAGWLGDSLARQMLPWLPLRDMMTFGVWCAGLLGREVVWRGQRFAVWGDGLLHPVERRVQEAIKNAFPPRSGSA